jgi:Zn-dependent protease
MSQFFVEYMFSDPVYYFSWVLAIMFSICVHEYAHTLVALRLGDDTAAQEGHLTLNPLVQMGVTSMVILLVIGIAWGQVPVNIHRLKSRGSRAAVAFAGPGSNLVLCILFGLLSAGAYLVIGGAAEGNMVLQFFELACVANGVLFIFNMLPVPMFDGWSVLAVAVPRLETISDQQAQTITIVFLMLLFALGLFSLVWVVGEMVAGGVIRGWLALLSPFF